ncbi:MAG: hypothetical protein GYB51_24545 [Rhodobacteraceae bacterium]|nr:hypothetical protein [Paracoccaceae bacterium]
MAMYNPAGRANYEPNSWKDGGPRADAEGGFTTYPEAIEGEKRKVRTELFADHYSQARQFYQSQTEVEQGHIADALIFELSKCEVLDIRKRVVAHLPNIDTDLAQTVSDGLGFDEMPEPDAPRRDMVEGLKPSDALSILKNGPDSFKGRKLGILVTDGIDGGLLASLQQAVKDVGGMVEIIAPTIGGIKTSDGKSVSADQKIDGGPSVLYDAVAVMAPADGVKKLATMHPAKGFAADAFAHAKFIALTGEAEKLFHAAGVDDFDEGVFRLEGKDDCADFIEACGKMRFWQRG